MGVFSRDKWAGGQILFLIAIAALFILGLSREIVDPYEPQESQLGIVMAVIENRERICGAIPAACGPYKETLVQLKSGRGIIVNVTDDAYVSVGDQVRVNLFRRRTSGEEKYEIVDIQEHPLP